MENVLSSQQTSVLYKEKHHCPIFVLGCIDFRFKDRIAGYIQENHGETDFDESLMAGASKNLLDETTQEVVLKQLKVTHDLHCSKLVYLTNHIDCGAYGGSKAFDSKEAEVAKLTEDLRTARDIVKAKYPDMEVKLLLLDWEETIEVA